MAVLGSSGAIASPAIGNGLVYSTRHEFPATEWTLRPIR